MKSVFLQQGKQGQGDKICFILKWIVVGGSRIQRRVVSPVSGRVSGNLAQQCAKALDT